MTTEKHFNNLSPVELELLALLAEECAEVVQIVGKILRHGLRNHHPQSGESNFHTLEREMGDVRAAMILLCESGIVSKAVLHRYADLKLQRLDQYLHHAAVPAALKVGK